MTTNDILREALYATAKATDDLVPGQGKYMKEFADKQYGRHEFIPRTDIDAWIPVCAFVTGENTCCGQTRDAEIHKVEVCCSECEHDAPVDEKGRCTHVSIGQGDNMDIDVCGHDCGAFGKTAQVYLGRDLAGIHNSGTCTLGKDGGPCEMCQRVNE